MSEATEIRTRIARLEAAMLSCTDMAEYARCLAALARLEAALSRAEGK